MEVLLFALLFVFVLAFLFGDSLGWIVRGLITRYINWSPVKRGVIVACCVWLGLGGWWIGTHRATIDRFAVWYIYDVLEKA